MSLFDPGEDLADRTERWGCFGSLALLTTGFGLVVWGVNIVRNSETNWFGWVMICLGIILVFLGGGWTFFGWFWFP